jgi:DnaJ family protein C protein 8
MDKNDISEPKNTTQSNNISNTNKLPSDPEILDREKQAELEMKKLLNELHSETNKMTSSYQIKRLLNTSFINPYEILMLTPDSSDDEIKKQYRTISLLVHPDKNQDPSAADAFHILEQAYKTLQDTDKRKTFQRIYREAKERVQYDREKENKKRKLKGFPLLPDDTFECEVNVMMRKIKDEVEERKQYAERQEFGNKKREREEEEFQKMKMEYENQQKKEWESYRDKRVKNWNKFQQKVTNGGKKGRYEIRPPQHKLVERNETHIEIFKPNI